MANLAALRLRFVDVVGRLDLLQNGSKATNLDNGANAFLQRALRHLDSEAFYISGLNRTYFGSIAQGAHYVEVKDLFSVDGLWLIDATGQIDLTDAGVPYTEFRSSYAGPVSQWDELAPTQWSLLDAIGLAPELIDKTSEQLGVQQALVGLDRVHYNRGSIVTNGDFTGSATGWTLDAGITYGTNALDVAIGAVRGYIEQSGASLGTDLTPSTLYVVELDLTKTNTDAAGQVSAVLGGGTEVVVSLRQKGDASAHVVIEASTPATLTTTSVKIGVNGAAGGNFTGTIDNVSVAQKQPLTPSSQTEEDFQRKAIVFNTPMDQAYTVEINGQFYSPDLTNDEDTNWWTMNFPDLIVYKAAEFYYSDLGNSTRMQHFGAIIEREVSRIDTADAAREMSGIMMEPLRGVPAKWK